jgi:hypothetical protein
MAKELIPNHTTATVKIHIRPGGYNEISQGWTNGFASRSASGSVYLNAEFTLLDGKYAGQKIFNVIGLRSPKNAHWGSKGRIFLRDIINSSYGLQPEDCSSSAQKARELRNIGDIDGLKFRALIKISKNQSGRAENVIDKAIMPDTHEPISPAKKLLRRDISTATSDRTKTPQWVK